LYIISDASFVAAPTRGRYRRGTTWLAWSIVTSMGLTALLPATAHAYHLPLWEAGIGFGAIHAPHYRGSKSSKDYALPVPYLIYRGERVRADREGFRGKLFETEKLKLDMSIAANVPVPSETGGARAGMPGLDPVLEFGPSLNLKLWRNQNKDAVLWLKVPLRAALSIGDPIVDYQGLVFSPYVQIAKYLHKESTRWRFKFSIGPIFATQRYHDYFYEVNPGYVTESRAEYHGTAGYSGSRFTFTLSRNSKRFYLGSFARYDNLTGATFGKSPLVETNDYFVFGVFFAWVFATSDIHPPHD
jgi:outer membrane protein